MVVPALLLLITATTAMLVAGLRFVLRRRGMLDLPNDRSNHVVPTPRGGGLAIMMVVLGMMVVLHAPLNLTGVTLLLTLVSWMDDRVGLSARTRLMAQVVAVVITLMTLPHLQPAQWWQPPMAPLLLLTVGVPLLWVAWINAVNFMDGIDGLTGSYMVMLLLAVLLIDFMMRGLSPSIALLAGVIIAANIGFLWFNLSPASIFMGDVGSVPLGFLSALVLWELAAKGWWIPALILPGYYLADVGITLLLRASRGERLMEAHSCHAYQRAVRAGASHAAVVCRIVAVQAVLTALAFTSLLGGWQASLCLILAVAWSISAVVWLGGGWSVLRQAPSSRTPELLSDGTV
jgi:UDP-N-acetylmuramyl pentapeptide phosphotransferase/UDP-N-acetylglucosamine-1-phosphate transferase